MLVPYSKFHRSVLFLALLTNKNGPRLKDYPDSLQGKWDYALNFWDSALKLHFEREELGIWSKLWREDPVLDEWIDLMRRQQQMIAEAYAKLTKSTVNEEMLHELGLLLEQHIRTKERKVFQYIQSMYSEKELVKLIE